MKRLICTLAALAMLIATCPPAQAEWQGPLRTNEAYTVLINNTGNAPSQFAAVTIFYLGSGRQLGVVSYSIAGAGAGVIVERIPNGTRRVIVEVNPPFKS